MGLSMKRFLIFWLLVGSPLVHAKTFRVGVALRFQDRTNTTATYFDEGIEIARKMFEAHHADSRIEIHRFGHDATMVSVSEAADRILRLKTPAVIGGEWTSEALVLSEKLGPAHVVLVTPTATNPDVTHNRPYTFRACFADDEVANRLARFTVETLHPKKIGVLQNISSPYTEYLSATFSESIAKGPSPPELLVQKVLGTAKDYGPQIDFFIAHHVTHLAMFTLDTDFREFVAQAGKKGFFPVYIGSDGWGPINTLYDTLIKGSPFGAKFVGYRNNYWREDAHTPMVNRFRIAFEAQYKRPPNATNAIGFDSAWVLFHAMRAAKNPDCGADIQAAMKTLPPLPVVTSDRFSFGPDNSPRKDLYVYRLDRRGLRYEARLK
jgi:branched-chain amino acid transport system substrate-binding protein